MVIMDLECLNVCKMIRKRTTIFCKKNSKNLQKFQIIKGKMSSQEEEGRGPSLDHAARCW